MLEMKEQPEECDSCEFKTGELKAYESMRFDSMESYTLPKEERPHKWLCILCASTMTGSALDYPLQYPDARVMRTICFVGNAILEEIRKVGR